MVIQPCKGMEGAIPCPLSTSAAAPQRVIFEIALPTSILQYAIREFEGRRLAKIVDARSYNDQVCFRIGLSRISNAHFNCEGNIRETFIDSLSLFLSSNSFDASGAGQERFLKPSFPIKDTVGYLELQREGKSVCPFLFATTQRRE